MFVFICRLISMVSYSQFLWKLILEYTRRKTTSILCGRTKLLHPTKSIKWGIYCNIQVILKRHNLACRPTLSSAIQMVKLNSSKSSTCSCSPCLSLDFILVPLIIILATSLWSRETLAYLTHAAALQPGLLLD